MLEGFASPEYVKPIKIWLQRIPGYGELTIPDNYPASSSTFSLDFTEEEETAIKTMEENIGTEESIIKEEDLPANTLLGSYFGTFDVMGTPGEETLLSPVQVNTTEALAYHYDEENETWNKVEDAHVVDGYVYGTLESFSPIAIFAVKKDTFLDTSNKIVTKPLFVANGVPVYIYKNDENKTIARDANGKETELPANAYVMGGTIDGSTCSTSITVDGAAVSKILAGSFGEDEDKPSVVTKAVVNLMNDAWVGGLTGSYYAVRTDEFELNVDNAYVSWIGNAESIWQDGGRKDAGTMDNMSLSAKQYTKKFSINASGLTCPLLFLGGNCGYTYTVEGSGSFVNSKIDYLICGGSNGGTEKASKVSVRDSKVHIFQTNNRGFINLVHEVTFTNCDIDNLFVCGDSTDSTVTGITGKVEKIQVSKSTLGKLYAGTQNGETVDKYDDLAAVLNKIVISSETSFEFGEDDGISTFGDLLKKV